MRLVDRTSRKIASKYDLESIVARRRNRRAAAKTVEPIEAPAIVVDEPAVEPEVDLLDKQANYRLVLEAAWISSISERGFGIKVFTPKTRGSDHGDTYRDVFRKIDWAQADTNERGRRNGWCYCEDSHDECYCHELGSLGRRWKKTILRRLEGKYCPSCWERNWRGFKGRKTKIEANPDCGMCQIQPKARA